MKPYAPHITFFAVLLGLLIFGSTANVQPLAFFFGSLIGAATDPLLLLGALAVGGGSKNLKILLPVAIVFGVLLSIYIANINEPLGAEFRLSTTVIRTVAVIGLAFIANAVRIAASGSNDKSSEKQ